jgi:NhaP-type Na+/H+ or K+/H+ antiporter
MLYLAFGYALGRGGLGLLDLDVDGHLPLVESIAEIGVVLSLFSVGLRLGVPLGDPAWRVPLRFAGPEMAITIGAAALAGWWLLDLGWASALLLAAIVAPTDPVLASDVQIRRVSERDAVRFGLTAEGGMNDGLAAAGILLALALYAGTTGLGRAVLTDVVWSLPAGLAIGWACGSGIGSLALALHRRKGAPEGFEAFLAARAHRARVRPRHARPRRGLSRGVRRGGRAATARDGGAGANAGAPAVIAGQLLAFNRQVEHIAEVVVVVLAGALLATVELDLRVLAFALAVILVARPFAVGLALAGAGVPARRHARCVRTGASGATSLASRIAEPGTSPSSPGGCPVGR